MDRNVLRRQCVDIYEGLNALLFGIFARFVLVLCLSSLMMYLFSYHYSHVIFSGLIIVMLCRIPLV